jgi:hypothetical protein
MQPQPIAAGEEQQQSAGAGAGAGTLLLGFRCVETAMAMIRPDFVLNGFLSVGF